MLSFTREIAFLLGVLTGLLFWIAADWYEGRPMRPMRTALVALVSVLLIVFRLL
jgi:hypothetical protein